MALPRAASPALVSALALVVRTAWLLGWQNPADTVYSDMGGYIGRAQRVIEGGDAEVCFPPGGHGFYALEMMAFGTDGLAAMGWVHVVIGAAIAPLALLTARHVLKHEASAIAVGVMVALWQPLLAYGGYFSSELPFAFFLAIGAWAVARWAATGRGALLGGLALGIAYLIRPPILLAAALVSAWSIARLPAKKAVIAFALPLLLAVGYGANRYHDLTGKWSLISDNGAVQSFFAWTDYRLLIGTVVKSNGKERVTKFQPPSRTKEEGFTVPFEFTGDHCEPAPLLAERDRVIATSSVVQLAGRAARNVRYLAYGNTLWPERNQAKEGLRKTLHLHWPKLVSWGLVPLTLLGLGVVVSRIRRHAEPSQRAAEVLAWFVIALVLGAAAYTGELRYRVPYDPLLLVFAAVAVEAAVGRMRPGPTQSGPPSR